ncbi:MAG: DUF559 domain-containing protein [Sphingomonadaceae bacterium]|nr:DUF559 domain-containing protein [Sphingomonadaceae bacterium]
MHGEGDRRRRWRGDGATQDDCAARDLRKRMTAPEVRLWALFKSRPGGVRLRRQHPIGPFILDFYYARARLAIEIDGMTHDMGDRPERDRRRDLWLADQGIATLRIAASEVMNDAEAVVAAICARCASPLHHPADGPPPHATHGEDERPLSTNTRRQLPLPSPSRREPGECSLRM